jgi:translation elongation factor EF-Ts
LRVTQRTGSADEYLAAINKLKRAAEKVSEKHAKTVKDSAQAALDITKSDLAIAAETRNAATAAARETLNQPTSPLLANNEIVAESTAAPKLATQQSLTADQVAQISSSAKTAEEIAKDQLRQEGKLEAMLDNIAKGKIQRFYKDNTLVNQDYIKDGSMSVSAYVKSVDAGLTVTGFSRVALG